MDQKPRYRLSRRTVIKIVDRIFARLLEEAKSVHGNEKATKWLGALADAMDNRGRLPAPISAFPLIQKDIDYLNQELQHEARVRAIAAKAKLQNEAEEAYLLQLQTALGIRLRTGTAHHILTILAATAGIALVGGIAYAIHRSHRPKE